MKGTSTQRKKAPADVVRLREFVAAAKLVVIDLVEMEAHREHLSASTLTLPLPPELLTNIRVSGQHQPELLGATGATFLAGLEITWSDKPTGTRLASASVTLRLAYAFDPMPKRPSQELIAAFGKDVAMHHAWPFLRERLDSLSSALGMPKVVLPLNHVSLRLLPSK